MTALDHLRAVLAVTNDKAYRTAGDQDVIEQARLYSLLPDYTFEAMEATICRFSHGQEIDSDYLCRHEDRLLDLYNLLHELRYAIPWIHNLQNCFRQAAWLAAHGPDCGRYAGKWYGFCSDG